MKIVILQGLSYQCLLATDSICYFIMAVAVHSAFIYAVTEIMGLYIQQSNYKLGRKSHNPSLEMMVPLNQLHLIADFHPGRYIKLREVTLSSNVFVFRLGLEYHL